MLTPRIRDTTGIIRDPSVLNHSEKPRHGRSWTRFLTGVLTGNTMSFLSISGVLRSYRLSFFPVNNFDRLKNHSNGSERV